jgi:hypothetical protein
VKVVNNPEHCEDESVQASDSAHVNIVRIDLGGSTLIVVVLLVAIIGACGVVMGIDIAERTAQARHYDLLERQYRMVELKLDDWTVVAHRSGLVLPGDYTRGPQGNLDQESFKQEKSNGSGRSNSEGKGATGSGH